MLISYKMSCLRGLFKDKKLIPVKVQDVKRERRIGFVAKSLGELKKKACVKFQISAKTCQFVMECDGTEVDDETFFQQMTPHTVLIILESGQTWSGKQVLLENALDLLLEVNHMKSLTEQIEHLILNEDDVERRHLLGKLVTSINMNIDAESREKDPLWFDGIPQKYKTKDSFMREKARARIRGYLYHAKDYISKEATGKAKKTLNSSLSNFITELKNHDYYSDHFSRLSDKGKLRMCDKRGWFHCEGSFNEDKCSYLDHHINPYGNRESRILFSTWDLDHGIEKSREILPQILCAAKSTPTGRKLNWLYFHELLFTRKNLKLVHPVCHDKSGHEEAKCDSKKFYIKS